MAYLKQLQSSRGSTCVSTKDEAATPFSQKIIELTQQEYIQLKRDGNYWRSQFKRLKKENDRLREHLEEVSLQQRRDLDCVNAQLLASQALVDQLQRQLYGASHTEKSRVRCKRGKWLRAMRVRVLPRDGGNGIHFRRNRLPHREWIW